MFKASKQEAHRESGESVASEGQRLNEICSQTSTKNDEISQKSASFQSQHFHIFNTFRHLEAVISICHKQRLPSDFQSVKFRFYESAGYNLEIEDVSAVHKILNVYNFEAIPVDGVHCRDNFNITFNYDIVPLQKNDSSLMLLLSRRFEYFRQEF